jgi:hypothetical protein
VLVLRRLQQSVSSRLLLGWEFYDHSTGEFGWRQEDEYLRLHDKGDIRVAAIPQNNGQIGVIGRLRHPITPN